MWALRSLCGLYRLPFDSALVAQQFPLPYNVGTFHDMARAVGIKTGSCPIAGLDWQQVPLPAVAFLRTPGGEGEALTALLILKTDGKLLSCFRAGSEVAEAIDVTQATDRFAPELLLFGKETIVDAGPDADIAGFANEKKAFGFRWFLPELAKHKNIWRDILLASLAIQLVGLATPLFTRRWLRSTPPLWRPTALASRSAPALPAVADAEGLARSGARALNRCRCKKGAWRNSRNAPFFMPRPGQCVVLTA